MKKKQKASLTVEASFIIPMVIIIVGIIISLWIYKYQLCWYTQAVSECLLTGSAQSILSDKDSETLTQMKWEAVKMGNYIDLQDLSVQIDGDKNEISMMLSGKISLWGNKALELQIEQEVEVVRPVDFIRKATVVKEVVEK